MKPGFHISGARVWSKPGDWVWSEPGAFKPWVQLHSTSGSRKLCSRTTHTAVQPAQPPPKDVEARRVDDDGKARVFPPHGLEREVREAGGAARHLPPRQARARGAEDDGDAHGAPAAQRQQHNYTTLLGIH